VKNQSRKTRIAEVMFSIILLWLFLFLVSAIIPSKVTFENFRNYPTHFENLSEKRIIRANFKTNNSGLERLDVLFKNPNLESRDELVIKVNKEDNGEIFRKTFTGFNFGDTSHARLDLPRGATTKGENLLIEVEMTRFVDGKLMLGTKNESLNFIQYYESSSKMAIFDRFSNIWLKAIKQPVVLLLPIVIGVLAVW